MKFLVGKNSLSYSDRSRGHLLAEQMPSDSYIINSVTEANNDIVKVSLPHFSQPLLDYFKKNKIPFILDVTDYKFHKEGLKKLYIDAAYHAIAVTTTCQYLADICKKLFNREVHIIKDLTERKESTPIIRKIDYNDTLKLVWYGIRDNMKGINFEKIKNDLKKIHPNIEIKIITNKKESDPLDWIQWDYDTQEKLVAEADIVLIPTMSSNNAKSKGNNRPVDAIRQGKYVISGNTIPSYHELKHFMFIGDLQEGVTFFLNYPDKVRNMVTKGQHYIKLNYSPEIIAAQWVSLESKLKEKNK